MKMQRTPINPLSMKPLTSDAMPFVVKKEQLYFRYENERKRKKERKKDCEKERNN
tara:strand:- start:631 stop:795 length:165 start_codon:yes stop_codon:yes gene_type:complete